MIARHIGDPHYELSGFEYHGFLGLSMTTELVDDSDSFVQMMKKQGIIQKAAFGLYFEDTEHGSEITFGAIDTHRVSTIDQLTFSDLNDNETWSLNITSMRYGDTELSEEVRYGLLDTLMPIIFLPGKEFDIFSNEITKHKSCSLSEDTLFCD